MTTPSSGDIKMTEINTELDLYTPAQNISMAGFYGIAPNTGGSALMFHNLSMAPGNSTTAKVAIWDNYNAGTNYAITNWYNYTRDVDVVMTYDITNNSAYTVNFNVGIWDMNDANVGTVFNGILNPTDNPTGTSTGPLALTIVGSSGYRITIQDIQFVPGPPPPPGTTYSVNITINSASDTDGVGGGTTRTTYGPFSYSETSGNPPTPFTPSKAVDTSGNLIAINKRTSVTITIS